jgi:hypothetical protein
MTYNGIELIRIMMSGELQKTGGMDLEGIPSWDDAESLAIPEADDTENVLGEGVDAIIARVVRGRERVGGVLDAVKKNDLFMARMQAKLDDTVLGQMTRRNSTVPPPSAF